MSQIHRDALLQSLADTIADYRQNEIHAITAAHVGRWLSQFDSVDQPVILTEMNSIMKRFYFSRVRVKECLHNFLKNDVIGYRDPLQVFSHLCFLRIQRRGNSQKALLDIVDEVIREEYNFTIASCGKSRIDTYVYIDDCIYTGSRIRYDLTAGDEAIAWIPKEAPSQCTLIVYNIGVHLFGMNYVDPLIRTAAREKGITVIRKYALIIDNTCFPTTKAEFLWPKNLVDESLVSSYTSNLRSFLTEKGWPINNLFRPNGVPRQETLFSSPQARRVVERAFLKKGIQIATAGRHRAESIRPLGFVKISSLGFGTLFTTYRNIANNCPLVLWWGDPKLPVTHPLGMWYPLFPRKTNNQIDEWMVE